MAFWSISVGINQERGLNLPLGGQEGPKMGPKFEIKYAETNEESFQWFNGSDWQSNKANKAQKC